MDGSWSAWYADGTRHDSARIAWNDLPPEGMQVLVVYHADGTRTIYDGADWYWFHDGKFGYAASSHEWGTQVPRPDQMCLSCVKRGTRMPDDEFAAIALTALAYRP